MTDADSTRHMLFEDSQKTPEGATALMEATLSSYETESPMLVWTIVDPVADAYCGACGLNPLEGGSLEVFYTLLPDHRGRGLATRAMRLLLKHAFETLQAHTLVAFVFAENEASVRVAERLGFANAGPVTHGGRTGQRFELRRDDWAARSER